MKKPCSMNRAWVLRYAIYMASCISSCRSAAWIWLSRAEPDLLLHDSVDFDGPCFIHHQREMAAVSWDAQESAIVAHTLFDPLPPTNCTVARAFHGGLFAICEPLWRPLNQAANHHLCDSRQRNRSCSGTSDTDGARCCLASCAAAATDDLELRHFSEG